MLASKSTSSVFTSILLTLAIAGASCTAETPTYEAPSLPSYNEKLGALTLDEQVNLLRKRVAVLDISIASLDAWKLSAVGSITELVALHAESATALASHDLMLQDLDSRLAGLESLVDALAAAGTAPVVVDANGQTIGNLMDFSRPPNCDGYPSPQPEVCNSYTVYSRELNRQFPLTDVFGLDSVLSYTTTNCTGTAYIAASTQLTEDPDTHSLLTHSGVVLKPSIKSQKIRGICSQVSMTSNVFVAEPVSNPPFALPLALPLSVQ